MSKTQPAITIDGLSIPLLGFGTWNLEPADARRMVSTFWIHELCETDDQGKPRFLMQYLQDVALDFLPRTDGTPGLIRWPHVSINTLEKVSG